MTVFVFSLLFVSYVWLIYPLVLLGLSRILPGKRRGAGGERTELPSITVVIAVHNEAESIGQRIKNIFSNGYPAHLLNVVVASDGSTDATADVVQHLTQHYAVKYIEQVPQKGRAAAHNLAFPECTGNVLLFTDADTHFEPGVIAKFGEEFCDESVGFASGNLFYRNENASGVAQSAGLYWRFERILRRLEDDLGLFVFGSGACCAVRRFLFRLLPPTGDVDFTTPLDVALQNHRCIHLDDVIAWDDLPASKEKELRARIRMTSKNLYGTVTRWGLKGIIRHPALSWVIASHKIGRWFTPFGMIGLIISNIFILSAGVGYDLFFVGQILFYLIAFCGYFRLPIPLAAQAYSFCLANLGFLVGVLKALVGRVPSAYVPISKS